MSPPDFRAKPEPAAWLFFSIGISSRMLCNSHRRFACVLLYHKHWTPLESNPTLFTELVHQLGVSPTIGFRDVLSLSDADLLALIPRPILALVMVFPMTAVYEIRKTVMFYKQTTNNACGLYSILHATCNGPARDAPARRLIEDDALEAAYKAVALRGDSAVPDDPEEEVGFHYVCFVKSHRDSHLYELDGDRKGPVNWERLAPDEDLLSYSALCVIKGFIQQVELSAGFGLLALAPQ
ncbi:cysteine proteinase [Xylariaceae sp. AK1471]|nr:cysteine proteinase [Xylariaceae sp. AK1471]